MYMQTFMYHNSIECFFDYQGLLVILQKSEV
jgi:hypothetical protein